MKAGVYLSLLVILIIAIVLRIHIISNIFINAFITEPLFITDLLGKGVIIPWSKVDPIVNTRNLLSYVFSSPPPFRA